MWPSGLRRKQATAPIGVYVGLIGCGVFFVALVSVVLINRPTLLVPPASRHDVGVLTALRRRRDGRRQR